MLSLWCDALRRNRRLREAEDAGIAAIKADEKSPDAHYALGNVLFDGGAYAKAGVRYQTALKLRPDWTAAQIGLGNVANEIKLIVLALQTFDKVTKAAPENPDGWIGLGRALLNQGQTYNKALEAYEKAAQLAPDRTDFFDHYSDALQAASQFDQAEAILRRRVADTPDDARSQYLLAMMLLDNKTSPDRQQEAERRLNISLTLEPRAGAARILLARRFMETNRFPQAEEQLLLTLRDDPKNANAVRMIARVFRRLKKNKEAEEAEAQGVAMAAYADEVRLWEEQERVNPISVTVHEKLAEVYAKGGESEKSQRQKEMAFMLTKYRSAAERGLKGLTNAIAPNKLSKDRTSNQAQGNR